MLNFHIPGETRPFGELAQRAEEKSLAAKRLSEERKRNDGLEKMIGEANEKVRVLEAKLLTARSELLKALHNKSDA